MAPGLPQIRQRDLPARRPRDELRATASIGGMFISGMYTAAFFETDPRKVVEAGLAAMPPKSPYARVIADVLAWSKQYPDDWDKVWQLDRTRSGTSASLVPKARCGRSISTPN